MHYNNSYALRMIWPNINNKKYLYSSSIVIVLSGGVCCIAIWQSIQYILNGNRKQLIHRESSERLIFYITANKVWTLLIVYLFVDATGHLIFQNNSEKWWGWICCTWKCAKQAFFTFLWAFWQLRGGMRLECIPIKTLYIVIPSLRKVKHLRPWKKGIKF